MGVFENTITIDEYGSYVPITPSLLEQSGRRIDLVHLANNLNDRINSLINIHDSVDASNSSIRICGIAGLIRLLPGLDLEIVPKFLLKDDSTWKEDFFLIALIAKYGQIIPKEHVSMQAGQNKSLLELVSISMMNMLDSNIRKPLRSYRQKKIKNFEIDGEMQEDEYPAYTEDGFLQEILVLDRDNKYNQVIAAAITDVINGLENSILARQLENKKRILGSISKNVKIPISVGKRLPPRHQHWQPLYDISCDVLGGNSLSYASAGMQSYQFGPGFIINTELAWESFITIVMRCGLIDFNIDRKHYSLGIRDKGNGAKENIITEPDITMTIPSDNKIILDAKYKGRAESELRISASDIYEMMAFLKSSNTKTAILLYPRPAKKGDIEIIPGGIQEFEKLTIGDMKIYGVAVEVKGIVRKGGFRKFADMFRNSFRTFLVQNGIANFNSNQIAQ